MCDHPVRIPIKQSSYINGFRPDTWSYDYVPCYKCASCRAVARQKFALLSQMESERNAFCYFITLTYMDMFLPRMVDKTTGEVDVPCFDRDDITKFRKSLTYQLSEYLGFDCSKDVQYSYFAEYGHDDWYQDDYGRWRLGTHRPHYHMLLFLNYHVPLRLLMQIIAKAWSYYDGGDKADPNSFHQRGRIDVQDARNKQALSRYVAKYVSKDVLSCGDVSCKDLSSLTRDERLHNRIVSLMSKEMRKELGVSKIKDGRTLFNFHHTSIGYGSNYVPSDEDLMNGYHTTNLPGLDVKSALPQKSVNEWLKQHCPYDDPYHYTFTPKSYCMFLHERSDGTKFLSLIPPSHRDYDDPGSVRSSSVTFDFVLSSKSLYRTKEYYDLKKVSHDAYLHTLFDDFSQYWSSSYSDVGGYDNWLYFYRIYVEGEADYYLRANKMREIAFRYADEYISLIRQWHNSLEQSQLWRSANNMVDVVHDTLFQSCHT